jgi:hypothetical protein
MKSLNEFKNTYKVEIEDFDLTDEEVLEAYSIYCDDPLQFHPDMISGVL